MPVTTLQHPMNEYRAPIEIPKWFIVLRDAKTTSFRDLKTLRDFAREEVEGTGIEYKTAHVTGILTDAWRRLKNTDVWILENKAGTKLHFCRASFQHKRGYIRKIEKESKDETMP